MSSKKNIKRLKKVKRIRRSRNTSSQKKKSPAASWRQFEELVTRVEQVLSPKGAIVKSPDHLIDKVTGQLREVDASIKFKVGTTTLIITIECRDRIKVQDTIWLEQLATKQVDLGISKTIAVTSNNFTEPAIKKAKFYGIEIRKVNKIDEESISKFLTIKQTQYNYNITDYALNVDIKEELLERFYDELKGYENKLFDVDMCTSYGTGNKINLRKILEESMYREKERIDKVEIPDQGHTNVFTLFTKIPKGQIYITTSFGKYDLIGLKTSFTLYKHEEFTMRQISEFIYANEEKDLIKGEEFEITSSKGSKELLTIHTDLDDGTSKATLWNEKNEKRI